MNPEDNDEIRCTLPRVDDCPYCGRRPNLERRDGLGFRFVCPAQEYRGSIIYRGRDA